MINVTDNNTVNTDEPLSDIFKRLNYPKPRFNLSVNTAMKLAKTAEFLSKTLAGWKEPPITQFGVSALVHSKTFNVEKMLNVFGVPKYTTEEGINAFIEWYKNDNKIVCSICAVIVGFEWVPDTSVWISILFTAILATFFAFLS